MRFNLWYLRSLKLTVLATSAILHPAFADYNRDGNNGFVDIISDASCLNNHSGRLSVDNCHGYVDCMNGFEIDRSECEEGTLFSMRTENCEPEDSVVCPRRANENPGTGQNPSSPNCGDRQCVTPDGSCGVLHQCLIDPCEMTRCEENEECVASFCGGCHATCTLKLNVIDQVINDGDITTRPPARTTEAPIITTKMPSQTTTPVLIDDGGAWVPDDGSHTVSTSPQIVYDDHDAVAPQSTTTVTPTENADADTTVAPQTTKENVVVDPTPAESTQVYVPSWTDHTCVAAEASDKKGRLLRGSSWKSAYATQYECCVKNFMYSLDLFESCVGFDLETLEPSSDGDQDYYPVWRNEQKCKASDGSEDEWMQTTFRPKKYLCCFEYFKWNFDNCLLA